MFAVLGNPKDNTFINQVKEDMLGWIARAEEFMERLHNAGKR
jgi:hypothetical protein